MTTNVTNALNIVTLNVRGLRGEKRYAVYHWLKCNNIDICLLQETFSTEKISDQFQRGWKGHISHSYTNSAHSRGVAILFREGLACDIDSIFKDKEGRILLMNIRVNNIEYSLCNIYSPNDVCKRITFLNSIRSFINKNATSQSNLFIGGDFNCVAFNEDKIRKSYDKSSNIFTNLKINLNVIDIWKKLNPEKK